VVGTSPEQEKVTMWLILGAEGQLGLSLQLVLSENNIPFISLGRTSLDIADRDQCRQTLAELTPSIVVNCAAWTAVDLAEDQEAEALSINCDGVRNIAIACREVGATLVHISTDYVFSGVAELPYETDATTAPVSAYGRTKLCGERAIQQELQDNYYVFRTAWLYSQFKNNFVKTMVRKALTHSPVRVVADQIGQPTEATSLARHIVEVVASEAPFGIFHGTNSGQASWYELTQAIYGSLNVDQSLVTPVTTSEYPTKAIRPKFSVLSHAHTLELGIAEMEHWKKTLLSVLPSITQQVLEEDN
jgi:dTDP-4-dehydrorhamnose reductase